MPSQWPKLELKIFPHLAQSRESEIIHRFGFSRYLNDRIDLPKMKALFASGSTASLVAKHQYRKLPQPFKEDRRSQIPQFASAMQWYFFIYDYSNVVQQRRFWNHEKFTRSKILSFQKNHVDIQGGHLIDFYHFYEESYFIE